MPHDIRSELSALQDDLASQGGSAYRPIHVFRTGGLFPTERWADLERALRELQTQLTDAAGEAEAVLTEHPFAAVAAAFLLGAAAGRMMGAAK